MRVVALLLILAPSVAAAADLVPFVEGERIGLEVRGLTFPNSLAKDLKSGLTNRLLIHFTLQGASAPPLQRAGEVTVRYDLWDENFKLKLTVEQTLYREETLASLEAVTAFLSDLRFGRLFAPVQLSVGTAYTATAEVLLNPIEKERMEKLKQWVAENGTQQLPTGNPGAPDPTVPAPQSTPPALISRSVFNRLLEQYAAGDQWAASWHQTLVSSLFRLDDLRHERH